MKGSEILPQDGNWVYQNLSELAKAHGGPEKLLDDVFNGGEKSGLIKGVVYTLGAAVVAGGSYITVKYFKQGKEKKKNQIYGKITVKPKDNDSGENIDT